MKKFITASFWLVAVVAYLSTGWIAGLALAVGALIATVMLVVRTARELAPALQCPRGHRVPTYGRVACSQCGWVSEGSVWRCRHCNARYGHTPCPHCGLSVRNPSLSGRS